MSATAVASGRDWCGPRCRRQEEAWTADDHSGRGAGTGLPIIHAMDKLKAFETFASVAARGSLSAAARAEGVAPAVVSRRLDALEEHLGVKLLVRTTRRLALTHEGTAFLDDCQRILAEVSGAEASVSAGGVQASGHLRVTAPAGFGRRHVAPLVPVFHAGHPRLRISLNLSDRVIDLAAEGYDCAVRVGDLPDSSLVSIRLADNRRLAVAAPGYLRRRGVPRHPRELAQHDCLALSSDASQTQGLGFRTLARAPGHAPANRAVRWTAPTARCCTTGAWRATASPGARPGRSSPRSPPACWCRCWRRTPRRPTASTPCCRTPRGTCRCGCGCGWTS